MRDQRIKKLKHGTWLGVILWFLTGVNIAMSQSDNLADIATISSGANNYAHITYAPGTTTQKWPANLAENHNSAYLAADFNGDGADDISCIDFDNNNDPFTVMTSSPGVDGDDQLQWTNDLRENSQLSFYFLPGDFDGDGNSDIASFYLESAGDDQDVFAKITYGPTGATQTATINDWYFAGARDDAFVSGRYSGNDSIDDIGVITRNANNFTVSFFEGPNGNEDVGNTWNIVTPTVQDVAVAFRSGDFNGDGDTDVATTYYNTATTAYATRIVFGPDGSSNALWDLGNTELVSILVNDFNNDGISDIAAVSDDAGDRSATIHIGNNSGAVAEVRQWTIESNEANVTHYLAGKFALSGFGITGTVYQQNGTTGLAGVTVTTDKGHTATTNSSGAYSFTYLGNDNYTITATKSGHTFSPASLAVTVNGVNLSNKNFTSTTNPQIYSISGKVYKYDGTTALSGATISAGGGLTATSDSSGNYTINNVASGSYSVTTSKQGYTFLSNPRTVVVNGANKATINFTAASPPKATVSGKVYIDMTRSRYASQSTTQGVQGVQVKLGSQTTTTNANGNYTFQNVSYGSYQLSATRTGYAFTADNFTNPLEVSQTSVSNKNLEATCVENYSQSAGVCVDNESLPGTSSGLEASDGPISQKVIVTWDVADNATSYQLYRSRFEGETGVPLGEPITSTTAYDTGAIPGVRYYYSVQALNASGVGGASNQDAGYRLSTDETSVCKYSDSLEEESDSCTSNEEKIKLNSPVFAGYNTFYNQYTFLELASNGADTIAATVTIYSDQGEVLGQVPVTIDSFSQFDLNLSDYVSQTNTYGTIRIVYDDTRESSRLSGRVSHYSIEEDGQSIAFAYSRELRNPTRGESYITGNSIDPLGTGEPVKNWSEIFNIENVTQYFNYRLYNQSGQIIREIYNVEIPPLGRIDLQAGHEDGEGVYLVEIVPRDGSLRYLAGVSRYGSSSTLIPEAENHSFAYPINSRIGNGEKQFVIVSNEIQGCWSQTNWIEMGNIRSVGVDVDLTFREPLGSIIGTTQISIPAKGLYHINASAMLPYNSIGSMEITPDKQGSLITESIVYYHDCEENNIQAAYSSPSRRPGVSKQLGSYNSFLGAVNRLQLLNVTTSIKNVEMNVSGTSAGNNPQTIEIGANSIVQLFLNQNSPWPIQPNTYGAIRVTSDEPKEVIGENLRMKEGVDGRIEYVVPSTMR